MKSIKTIALIASFVIWSSGYLVIPQAAESPKAPSYYLEELTWQEVDKLIDGGFTTVIVGTGSTEQGGPHLVLGAHTTVMRFTAGEIAKGLGNTLVAPIIPFAPAGRIRPPEGHMLFTGTISLSDNTYSIMLEDIVRSLKKHGFKLICLIGDHKGSQLVQWQLAEKLTKEWKSDRVQVLNVPDYFLKNGQDEWSDANSKVQNAKAHGGHIQTSELMALDAGGVRDALRAVRSEHDHKTTGSAGDSSQANNNYGRKFLGLKIDAAIKQIQNASSKTK